jgi:hypothetical protein
MQQVASHKTAQPSSRPDGALILRIKNGRLSLFLVADSDKEEALLLSEFRDAIVTGDLWTLIE